MATPKKRSSSEIRKSIDDERQALSTALTSLRGEVTELTDWRRQVAKHKDGLIVAGAVVGGLAVAGLVLKRLFSSS